MKIKKLLLILPVVTVILEALPYGAVLNFANPEGDPIRKTFSYFSLVPFGYANFAPFITAIITCIVFVMLLVYCITEKAIALKLSEILLAIAAGLSLCPLALGVTFTPVAALIHISLIVELVFVHFYKD